MSSKNSQCETFLQLLDAYVDNELDSSEKEQVQSHVQACDECKAQVKQIETLKVSLSTLPRRQMKRDLADSLDAVLGNADRLGSSSQTSASSTDQNVVPIAGKRRWVVAAASAAAVLVVAMAGAMVFKSGNQQIASVDSQSQPAAQSSVPQGNAPSAVAIKNSGNGGGDKKSLIAGNSSAVKDVRVSDLPPKVAQKQNVSQEPYSGIANSSEVPKTAGAHMTGAQEDNSKTAVVAHNEGSQAITGRAPSTELLALYEDDDDNSDIGVMTDEDGLYAIKL